MDWSDTKIITDRFQARPVYEVTTLREAKSFPLKPAFHFYKELFLVA